jgi:hypothetical protein
VNPEVLLKCLFVATGAKTEEEKARIAWRFSDAMWNQMGEIPIPVCRHFNDLLQQQEWPWVQDLWAKDEVVANLKARGMTDDFIATLVK